MPTGDSRALPMMWLSVVRASWRTLALVSTDPATSGHLVADALVDTAKLQLQGFGEFEIVDAENLDVSPSDAAHVMQALAPGASQRRRLILLPSPLYHAAAVPLLRACDAAILIVRLGASEIDQTRAIIEIVGREHILGAITLSKSIARDRSTRATHVAESQTLTMPKRHRGE
jgi:hypothetical protein